MQTSRPLLSLAGVTAAEVRRRADAMLERLGLGPRELSVLLTDDRRIHVLNRDYRGKDRPTDVLAFAMEEGDGLGGGELLGDVVISLETAARQAAERRREPLDEVTHLLAHGLLHLVGYDHQTDAEHRAMERKARVLRAAAEPGAPNASPQAASKKASAPPQRGAKGSKPSTKRAAAPSKGAAKRASRAPKGGARAAAKGASGAPRRARAGGSTQAPAAAERASRGATSPAQRARRGASSGAPRAAKRA
ncbi:MAG TPA: rRNA maturation RNase YbeY [Polyangiaceae bacterium]|nr:rRNA maturation RNase YbeY [Polyangiaceae bacterium]